MVFLSQGFKNLQWYSMTAKRAACALFCFTLFFLSAQLFVLNVRYFTAACRLLLTKSPSYAVCCSCNPFVSSYTAFIDRPKRDW